MNIDFVATWIRKAFWLRMPMCQVRPPERSLWNVVATVSESDSNGIVAVVFQPLRSILLKVQLVPRLFLQCFYRAVLSEGVFFCIFWPETLTARPPEIFFFRTAFTANLSTSTVSQNCEAGDVSSLSIQSLLRKKRKVNVSHTKKQTYIASNSKIIESTFALPNLLFIVVATILIAPATLANSQICWLCFAVSKP